MTRIPDYAMNCRTMRHEQQLIVGGKFIYFYLDGNSSIEDNWLNVVFSARDENVKDFHRIA